MKKCFITICLAFKACNLKLCHARVFELAKVNLVTLDTLASALLLFTVIEIKQTRVVTQTADEVEAKLLDSIGKGLC